MVEVDIRQQGRGYSPLWRPRFRARYRSGFKYARAEPLADQAQQPTIIDPLLNHTAKRTVLNRVEVRTNVRIDDPAYTTGHTLDSERFERIMGTATRAKSVGERVEILLVDRTHKHDDRSLDNLVLKDGDAYGPAASIGLLKPDTLHRWCFVASTA